MRRKNTTSEMMRGWLIESLLRLMEEKPFDQISVGEIAKKAGVNRSTYYRHFSRREDLLFAFLEDMLNQYLQNVRPSRPDLETYLRDMFCHFLRYRTQLLLLYQNGLSGILLDVLNQKFRAGLNREKPAAEQYRLAYHIGGVYNHLLFWFSRAMEDPPDVLARAAMTLFPPGFTPYLLGP